MLSLAPRVQDTGHAIVAHDSSSRRVFGPTNGTQPQHPRHDVEAGSECDCDSPETAESRDAAPGEPGITAPPVRPRFAGISSGGCRLGNCSGRLTFEARLQNP